MKCAALGELLALYVEDDLQEDDRGRVESHLRGCVKCTVLVEELRESQAVFKTLRQQVPGSGALANLRERVLAEVEVLGTSSWWTLWLERFVFGGVRRKAVLAVLALFAIGWGRLWFEQTKAVSGERERAEANPGPVVTAVPEPLPSLAPAGPRRARRTAAIRKITPVEKQVKPQIAIKLLTDDPNVIIYWLVDEQGD